MKRPLSAAVLSSFTHSAMYEYSRSCRHFSPSNGVSQCRRVGLLDLRLNHANQENAGLGLLSTANKSIRTCISDCVLPRGGGSKGDSPIFVRKGTQIDMDFGLLQKDEDLWGPDATRFRPERWEKLKPMWKCIPFLGGPRICPAQQMVLTQYGYLLVRFIQEFECNGESGWRDEICGGGQNEATKPQWGQGSVLQ